MVNEDADHGFLARTSLGECHLTSGTLGRDGILGRRRSCQISGRRISGGLNAIEGSKLGQKKKKNDSTITVLVVNKDQVWSTKEQRESKPVRYQKWEEACAVYLVSNRAGLAVRDLQSSDGWKIKFSR